jgi:Polyketide cyclase / dehydrase and lipid transport
MPTIEESIEVEVPVRTAYNQWTQFEEFPKFMEGIEQVHQKDDTHLHWRASIGGQTEEWDAKIVEQIPDRKVAWKATTGKGNAGVVTFQMEWDAEGLAEKAGGAIGLDSRRVQGDLDRFKEMIESRGGETGAWRGEVRGGQQQS